MARHRFYCVQLVAVIRVLIYVSELVLALQPGPHGKVTEEYPLEFYREMEVAS
jgi:hypothetical protein